ncbi:hypothetical protein [Sphingobium yanoikuyae]|uniref:hypothetical protein n=1 Tax=Sphingobium yanoikuyae TaxID=13690 RepID=UPI0026EF20A4|nr:hypothetical protein [Sphingobium yanoikuyae]
MDTKFIMNCAPSEAEELAALMVREIPTFQRSCRGPGWGWSYALRSGRTFFIRQTKSGLSAVPHDPAPEKDQPHDQ